MVPKSVANDGELGTCIAAALTYHRSKGRKS